MFQEKKANNSTSFQNMQIKATPPVCDLLFVLRKEEELCAEMLSQEGQNKTFENDQFMSSGTCAGMWDNMSCWPSSSIGQTVSAHCPEFFQMLTGKKGFVHRNCTSEGWSETFPRPDVACGYDVNNTANEERRVYFMKLKTMYTVGYSTSLGTLTVAVGILASFRRLHCTRNYIHMHLFTSFIFRALSNLIKDAVLFSSEDVNYCGTHTVNPQTSRIFILLQANYSWLLVEGLAISNPLVCFLVSRKGSSFAVGIWGSKKYIFFFSYYYYRCWDINTNVAIWWIIRGPVVLSIFVNFILFVNILRILMRKLKSPEGRGNDFNQYKRLAKSTLLLIPLFGIHYIIFAFFPEDVNSGTMEIQLVFELALGSFQGFIVAVLYCFLNGEVQLEIHRKWRQWHLSQHVHLNQHLSFSSSNEGSGFTQVMQMMKPSPQEQKRQTIQKSSVI
uniref:Secretin receptor n=1 Tax=Chelonoidis abingdonii TaxID=106734 RepID=A0A8C0GP69_CHEAB